MCSGTKSITTFRLMKKYLLTGGAGFVGSNLAEAIIKRGDKVKIIDDLSSGRKENIEELLQVYPQNIEFVEGSISDDGLLEKEISDIDYIVHLAAITSVPHSIKEPVLSNKVNIDGFVNVLNAAKEKGVGKIIFLSSAAIYGDSPALPKIETMLPEPLSPYAIGKITGEYYARIFAALYGLKVVCLRCFNIFGPKQDPNSQYASVIPRFLKLMLRGEQPVIFGDGKQTRDFVFIQDVIEAILLAVEKEVSASWPINIGSGREVDLLQLVEVINKVLSQNIQPKFSAPRPGDIIRSFSDISRAKEMLGWQPKTSLEEGMRATKEWYGQGLKMENEKYKTTI